MQYKYSKQEVLQDLNQQIDASSIIKAIRLKELSVVDTTTIASYHEIEQLFLSSIDDLSNLDLSCFSELREILIEEINTFDFSGTKIQDLTSLEQLSIQNCRIGGTIDLSNLEHLNYLKVSKSQINRIILPDTLDNITHIDLSENNLDCLPSQLSFYTTLETLFINNNCLKELITFEPSFSSLTTLYAHSNQLTHIKKELKNLTNLQKLHLGHNNISTIEYLPQSITSLHLNNNNLSTNLESLQELDNLEELFLSKNVLKSISLTNFLQLKKLKLDHCALESFPKDLDSLEQLTFFDISNNPIKMPKGTPIAFTNKALENLCINNCFTKKDNALQLNIKSKKIKHLELSGSNITSIEVSPIPYSLKSINLSFNKLRSIPFWLLRLKKLEFLDVSENHIQELKPIEHSSFPILRTLNLNANKLISIPPLLTHLKQLEQVDLSENNIEKIDLSLFQEFPNLKLIDLSYNPLKNPPSTEEIATLGFEVEM